MLTMCTCGETHELARKTMDSMKGRVAELFLSEIDPMPYIKGTHGGRNYYIGNEAVSYCFLNFYRLESGGETKCDLVTIFKKCTAAKDNGEDGAETEDLVSKEYTMMPIPCPWWKRSLRTD